MKKKEEKYLTPVEVEKITGMKLSTIHGWCQTKRLKAEKVGRLWRIHPDDLTTFLENRDEKKRLYNYSYSAVKKMRKKKKAGTLVRVTSTLIEKAELVRQRRLVIIKARFPGPTKPGEIATWVKAYMPTGTEPFTERTKILHY